MNFSRVIAIDGPSGSGKSTIAKKIASLLNVLYVDTGAMYRALGHTFSENGIPFVDNDELTEFLESISLEYGRSKDCLIEVNGENLTEIIRQHEISELASKISRLDSIRKYLVDFQRQLVQTKTCVMEGRDIGTVVFPKAFIKIFLIASLEVRAQRRLDQLISKGQKDHTLSKVIEDVRARDESDTTRANSPLVKSDDAIELDTSHLTEQQVLEEIAQLVRLRAKGLGMSL